MRRRLLLLPAVLLAGAGSSAGAAADARAATGNGPLAFANAGDLVVQPLSGAAPRVVPAQASVIGATPDGKLLASSSGADGDVRVSDAKGRVVREFDLRGIAIHSLDISEDGKRLAITAFRDAEPVPGRIYPYVASIKGTGLRRLGTRVRFAYDLRFTGAGSALISAGAPSTGPYAGCASLWRIRLDGAQDRLLYQARGGETPCVVGLAVSPGGSTIAFTGDPAPKQPSVPGVPRTGLYRLGLRGAPAPALLRPQTYAVAWSPRGDQLAFSTPAGVFRVGQFGGPDVQVSMLSTLSLRWLGAAG